MTINELHELRNKILSISLEPPWCENMWYLKKWIEGYEACQTNIVYLIDSMINNLESNQQKN